MQLRGAPIPTMHVKCRTNFRKCPSDRPAPFVNKWSVYGGVRFENVHHEGRDSDVTGVAVCPPVAMDAGVGLLCQLFVRWGRVPAGVLALTEWLLGEEEGDLEAAADEASSLDEEDFLFEKGDLNLWAEPVQWVKLLHRHLRDLIRTWNQTEDPGDPGAAELDPSRVHSLSVQAQSRSLSSQHALDSLPALPQFCCTMEHARLTLRHQRATLALELLQRLR